jgi:hypothetical protein
MRKILASMIVFVFGLPITQAEEWNSPDGLFSFTIPEGFVHNAELPLEPQALQHWSSDEHSSILTMAIFAVPKRLTRSQLNDFAKGFIEGTKQIFVDEQGKPLPNIRTIQSNSGETKDGFFFCDVMMSAKIPEFDTQVSVYQYAILINEVAYKLMIISYDALPLEIPGINNCIASIKVHATPKPVLANDNLSPADRLAQHMGSIAFFCLLLAGIIYLISRSRRSKTIHHSSTGEDIPFEN